MIKILLAKNVTNVQIFMRIIFNEDLSESQVGSDFD